MQQQLNELKKLLLTAENTAFGKHYAFREILESDNILQAFQSQVPITDFNTIYNEWWHRCLTGEADVCWPGSVRYFALSSGTSESASKHIPVTRDMIRSLRKATIRHMLTLGHYDLPASFFTKGILWLGGSTDLTRSGGYYEGDISGISARRVPIWFQKYYKPGKKISKERDWTVKLEEIIQKAPEWDIGLLTGVPSWIQILLEKIISHYNLKSIHDIWPNLQVYAHGGVSFEPYRAYFDKFFSKPVHYIEMYPASEGFIAFQDKPGAKQMKLIINNGIFYEFVPFNEENFLDNGELKTGAKAVAIDAVEANCNYALLLSTCAGAWRYLIGDTIRFTNPDKGEIVISGRTKHFLSLTGEHLSVDNMNKAIEMVSKEFHMEIPEYTVAGKKQGNRFYHHWYLGVNNANAENNKIAIYLDDCLKKLNDDYAVERISALNEITITLISPEIFYRYMESKGKMGGQNKFPRVLKSNTLNEWEDFVGKNQ